MEITKALAIKNRYLLRVLAFLSLINVVAFLLLVNVRVYQPVNNTQLVPRTIQNISNIIFFNQVHRRSQSFSENSEFTFSSKVNHERATTTNANQTRILQGHIAESNEFKVEQPFAFLGEALGILMKTFQDAGTVKRQALKNKRLDYIWNVWNMTFLIDKADICLGVTEDSTNIFAMVAVMSAPDNVEARKAIRATWGRRFSSLDRKHSSRLVFFIGRPKSATMQQHLEQEDLLENDIVQANFVDDYQNLTLKSVLLLRWAARNCPTATFLFKVDDDVFVNVDNIISLMEHNQKLHNTIFGRLARRWHPIRDQSSHYFVPATNWTSKIYPDFVAGPAYVMTSDVIPKLLNQVSSLPYFFLEDVYITGMCAQKAHVTRLHHKGFKTLRNPLNPCIYHTFMTVHNLAPENLRKAWNLMQNYGPNATECWKQMCVQNWFGICMNFKTIPIDFSRTGINLTN